MTPDLDARLALARAVAARYGAHVEVLAVAVAGSVGSGLVTAASDIDLYVYGDPRVDLVDRRRIATYGARRSEVGNTFWETGDEWIDDDTGIGVDVMFRDPAWIERELDRVLIRHEASVGWTTCLWANVRDSIPLHDPEAWYGRLRERTLIDYPEPLRVAIVAKNLPLLRGALSGYRPQLAKAEARRDIVSLNHRAAAFLASVFDILFAVNRVPHPGEKRLLEIVAARCSRVPNAFDDDVASFLRAAAAGTGVLETADRLTDGLEALIVAEGIDLPA